MDARAWMGRVAPGAGLAGGLAAQAPGKEPAAATTTSLAFIPDNEPPSAAILGLGALVARVRPR